MWLTQIFGPKRRVAHRFGSDSPSESAEPTRKQRKRPSLMEYRFSDSTWGEEGIDISNYLRMKIENELAKEDAEEWPMYGGFADMMAIAKRDRKSLNLGRFVVYPNSTARMSWDVTMLVMLGYVAIFTPFQMAFLAEVQDITRPLDWVGFFIMDRVVDLIFIVDIIINFRSGWFQPGSTVVCFDAHEAARRYLRGWLTLDILSVAPWDLLSVIVRIDDTSVLRFPKLLKLVRLMKILKILRASRVVARLEENFGVKCTIRVNSELCSWCMI